VSDRAGRFVLDQHAFAAFLAGAAIFVLFATPTIKLYLYTEAINVVPPLLLVASTLLNPAVRITETRVAALLLALGFFVLLFAYGAYDSSSLTLADIAKYAILCLVCALVPLVADRKSVAVAVILIAAWGLALAAIKLSIGIALSRDKGQTYLTLGYALGCSSLIGLLTAAAARSLLARVAGLLCFGLAAVAAATLLGRGPILLPIFVFLIYLGANTVFEPSARKIFTRLMVAVVLLVPAGYYSWQVLSAERVFKRLQMLSNIANEPRISETYVPILNAIAERPFGYGLEASQRLIGVYPHNIFLEVWVSGGAPALVVFLAIVGLFLRHLASAARSTTSWSMQFAFFLTLYYFAMWNISFGLSSAYAVLPMMIYFASRTRIEVAWPRAMAAVPR
jgi:O-antigen ligase